MGMTEHRTHELESNGLGMSRTSENLAQNANYEPLKPDDSKLVSELMVVEPVEQKEVTGAHNVEEKLGPVEESLLGADKLGPSAEDISLNFHAEKGGKLLENMKTLPVVESSEAPSKNEPINLEDMDLPPGFAYPTPGNGVLEPKAEVVTDNSGPLEDDTENTPGQVRNGKAKLKSPVTSSWALRSKSEEKPKAPEPPSEIANEVSASKEKKRRGKKKQQIKKDGVDEFSRARRHLRYLLHRIKYEQNLIDAYSAEGWKGQSLEKLKPEKELQRAKSHILSYKLKIRELFQRLDSSLALGKLPASLFDAEGEIDSEDIFCAKCGSKDLSLENDIILCDGACERGFHQFCLEPPLLKEHIPPGDESWLCPGCECKVDCLDMLKDFQTTKITVLDSWEKIFPEAAAAASGKKLDEDPVSSSEDSEDDDYDPDKPDTKVEGNESCSDKSDYVSASDEMPVSPKNESVWPMGLPPDDSEDDDFDPTAADPDEQVNHQSSSSDFTSDSEDLGALLDDAAAPGEDPEHISASPDQNQISGGSKEDHFRVGRKGRQTLKDELSYLLETVDQPVSGKRHVKRLDYKKLHDETYQDSSSDSSDEEFDDKPVRKRRKINQDKTEVTSSDKTPVVESKIDTKDENQKESPPLPRRTRRSSVGDGTKEVMSLHKTPTAESKIDTKDENQKESPHLPRRSRRTRTGEGTKEASASAGSSAGAKRSHKRLGADVTQGLLKSFNQNQYPDKTAKEHLANELGITVQQVSKWFENTRWQFNHRPQSELFKPLEPQANVNATVKEG